MSKDAKKRPTGNERASRRVECLNSEPDFPIPDIYAEASPIDRNDHDPADDSPAEKGEEIDKSAGFNPYDTGALYKE